MDRPITNRLRRLATAATTTLATVHAATALAHGDHGPGGHARWDLDHAGTGDWTMLLAAGAVAMVVVVAAVAVAAVMRSRRRAGRRRVDR